jgi:hypothetical protein
MNANCAQVVPCFFDEILRGGARERDRTPHGRTRRARTQIFRSKNSMTSADNGVELQKLAVIPRL